MKTPTNESYSFILLCGKYLKDRILFTKYFHTNFPSSYIRKEKNLNKFIIINNSHYKVTNRKCKKLSKRTKILSKNEKN